MKKEEEKKIIKEFEEWHITTSLINWGHFPWKHSRAKIKNGYWYWDGYKISDLHNILNKNI